MRLRSPLLMVVLAGAVGACGPVGRRTVRVEAGAEPPGEEGGSGGSSTPSSGGASGSIGTGGASGGGTGGSMTGGSGGTGGSGDTGGSGGAGGMMPVPPDAAPDAPRGGTGGVDAMPPARDTAPVPPDTAPSSTLGHGLVSRWKLDEGSGATARDAVTASGNDGMISGGNSWAQTGFPMAKYPNMGALTFSGGVMDVGVKGMPSLTQATSISLWVNYGSVPGATQPFIGFGAAGTGRLKMGFNGGELAAWRGMGSTVLVGTAPPASGWHHVAYTFDGTTRRLYIDGTSRAMSTAAGETGAVTDGQIGSYGTQNFAGTLDEIRVYNRALTAAEVTALANGNE